MDNRALVVLAWFPFPDITWEPKPLFIAKKDAYFPGYGGYIFTLQTKDLSHISQQPPCNKIKFKPHQNPVYDYHENNEGRLGLK